MTDSARRQQKHGHERRSGPLPPRAKSSVLPRLGTSDDQAESERDASSRPSKKPNKPQSSNNARAPDEVPSRVRSAPPIKTKKLSMVENGDSPSPMIGSGTFLFRPSLSEDRPLLGEAYDPVATKPPPPHHHPARDKFGPGSSPVRRSSQFNARPTLSQGLDLIRPSGLQIKIRIIGVNAVGKSTFMRAVTDANALLSSDEATFAIGDCLCKVRLYEVPLESVRRPIEEGIEWDGVEGDDPADGRGTILMYDVMNANSLHGMPEALNALKVLGDPVVLVAAKCDNPSPARVLHPEIISRRARSVIRDIETFESALYEKESPGLAVRCLLSKIISRKRPDSSRSASDAENAETGIMTPPISPSKRVQSSLSPSRRSAARGLIYRSVEEMPKISSQIAPKPLEQSIRESKTAPLNVSNQPERRFSHSFLILGESPPSADEGNTLNELYGRGRIEPLSADSSVTFEDLVARLLRPVPSEDEEDFVLTFLAFYRLFAPPSKLLEAIIAHYMSVREDVVLPWEHATSVDRDLSIIDLWITQYPGDFAKPKTRNMLQLFLDRISPDSDSQEGEPIMNDGEYLDSASDGGDQTTSIAAAHQIRLALQSVVEDEDTEWACSDEGVVNRGRSKTFLSISSLDSTEPTGIVSTAPRTQIQSAKMHAAHDNKVIFGGQATVTLSAIGRGRSADGLSLSASSSSTLLNVAESANRQATLLIPTPKRALDKDSWRAFLLHADELIARELTRIDWILFSAIRPRDLIRNITRAPASDEPLQADGDNTHENVVRMIDHFNHLAYWVTNLILFREKPKHRAQMLEKLMRVARRLRKLNNYYGLSAFIAAILSPPVNRLTATKELVDADVQKKFASLVVLMSTSRSHWAYRFALETTERAACPRIPFLPLHRRDLIIIESTGRTLVKDKKTGAATATLSGERMPELTPDSTTSARPQTAIQTKQISPPVLNSTSKTSPASITSSRKSSLTLGSTLSPFGPDATPNSNSLLPAMTSTTSKPIPLQAPFSPTITAPRINWAKFAMSGSTLRILQRAQACPYTGFVVNEDVRRVLLELKLCKDDDELYDRSCTLEGPTSAGAGINSGSFGGPADVGGGVGVGVGSKMRERIQGGLEKLKGL